MADVEFEALLMQGFRAAPSTLDHEAFVERVIGRLENGWTVRRVAILAGGASVGLAVLVQLVSARFVSQLQTLSNDGVKGLTVWIDQAVSRGTNVLALTPGTELIWTAAGLGGLAIALLATRILDDV